MDIQKLFSDIILFTATILVIFISNLQAQSTVKIGTQTWMTQNLNVDKFLNGDAIPHVQDVTQWKTASGAGFCYYENKTSYGNTYGKLYNLYAVLDPRGLAPKGFHIPTDQDWNILINYLGGEDSAGAKLKSNFGWEENGNGTNSSGFSGLPGGDRKWYGEFNNIGYGGVWWSSTTHDYGPAMSKPRSLTYYKPWVGSANGLALKEGYSVRCLKD